jgi:4-amino-4-deoxy-L-arabinose transferase-like glycosyltransferase
MARRQSRNSRSRRAPRGKSESERRVELMTWALLVLVFAILQIVPDGTAPYYFVPLAGAIILLGSGLYQYSRRWQVSPLTWLGGLGMAGLTWYGFQVSPGRDFTGESLIIFAAVIIFGVITGET